MKINIYITVIGLLCTAIAGCEKYSDDYKQYLDNKEIVYPGLARGLTYATGNKRVKLLWSPSPDPSIERYVISWNNGSDSVTVNATSHDPGDTLSVIVPDLNEYVYTFQMISYDAGGHRSVGQELSNVRVYGPTYASGLLNRGVNLSSPYEFVDGKLKLNFNKASTDALTFNTTTTIKYTNSADATAEAILPAADEAITLPDYKRGTTVYYRSAYIPSPTSIDEFTPADFDEFPEIISISPVDRTLFSALHLPGDIGSAYGWEMPYIWDGRFTDEPGFHTPGADMPFWITFDMGQQASLVNFKIWQRQSGIYNYGNPKRFEVWGSNNPAGDGSWDSWTKLGEFTTQKPSGLPLGQNSDQDIATARAGDQYVFAQPTEPVRYIRLKILESWNGNYFHILEIAFNKKD